MSNDTQVQAHMALVDDLFVAALSYGRESTAYANRRAAVEASARQLAEQGAPLDYRLMREARDALCEYANTGEVSSDVESLIASMSFSLAIEERPLTASPTAPSTEASEPVRDELTDEQRYALVEEHLGLKKHRDDLVIDPRTGRYTDAARYFDLIDAARALKGTP